MRTASVVWQQAAHTSYNLLAAQREPQEKAYKGSPEAVGWTAFGTSIYCNKTEDSNSLTKRHKEQSICLSQFTLKKGHIFFQTPNFVKESRSLKLT